MKGLIAERMTGGLDREGAEEVIDEYLLLIADYLKRMAADIEANLDGDSDEIRAQKAVEHMKEMAAAIEADPDADSE